MQQINIYLMECLEYQLKDMELFVYRVELEGFR